MKPTMYVANVAEHGFENNPLLDARARARGERKARRSSRSARRSKREIADLDDDDKAMFLDDMGMTEPGLDRADPRRAIELLGLQTYFTAGRRKCARGPSASAPRRRRRPA